jgi:hypothetical protein
MSETRKPRGRPRLPPDQVKVSVNVGVPPRDYDKLYAAARRADCTIPELIRRRLAGRRDDDERR